MAYELVTSEAGSGSQDLQFYLYPNTDSEYHTVEKGSLPVNALESLGSQLLDKSDLGAYEIYKSSEYPGLDPSNDTEPVLNNWEWWSGSNNKNNTIGCHMLLYQIDSARANGHSVHPDVGGAFYNSESCVVALSKISEMQRERNLVIHEAAHTLIDGNQTSNEHELGTIYSGWFGDGPSSPMAGGYENDDARNGECSSDAPWNFSNDETLTSCAIDAIRATGDL